jgi:hypothetical protein
VERRLTGATRTAVLAFAALLAGGGSAMADVAGGEYREARLSSTTSFADSASAQCSPGRASLGGGFSVSDRIVLDDLRPLPDFSGYRVQGVRGEGSPAQWGLSAYAICAKPLPGQQLVSATSAFDSSNKEATAFCPAGKRLVGTGAEINAGNGEVVLDGIVPNPGLMSLTVQAAEDQTGYGGAWSVTAHATCANPPNGLRLTQTNSPPDIYGFSRLRCTNGGAMAGGFDVVGATGEARVITMLGADPTFRVVPDADGISSPWSFTGYLICAEGTFRTSTTKGPDSANKDVNTGCFHILAPGAEITGAQGEVAIRNIDPNSSTSGVIVKATENAPGTPANWSATAWAICSSGNIAQRVRVTSPPSSSTKSVTATCPEGQRVLGVGGAVSEDNGHVLLDALIQSPDLRSATATGVEGQSGFAGDWIVRVDAFCAPELPGLERVSAFSGLDSNGKSVVATCPGRKNLVGMGADLSGAGGQASLNGIVPDQLLSTATVRASEDYDGYSGAWGLTTVAVCADP